MELTAAEKLMLLMLADIHTHLHVRGEIDAAFVRDAIEHGQVWALAQKYPLGATEDAARAQVDEVYDVLEMWWLLEPAYARLNARDKARVDEANHGPVQLPGFDGHESQLSIAKWIVERMDQFQGIRPRVVDCHDSVRDEYAAMLAVFKPMRELIGTQGGLTADDIISVVLAPRRQREAREAAAKLVAGPTEGAASADDEPPTGLH